MRDWQNTIRKRSEADQERLENAYEMLTGVTHSGVPPIEKNRDRSQDTAYALREICTFFHIPTPEFQPDSLENEEYVRSVLRKNGVMSRPCLLGESWYRNAFGSYLCTLKNGATAALLPGLFGRYTCTDRSTGQSVVFDKKNKSLVEPEAVLYYRPIPQRALDAKDLLHFMRRCIWKSEYVLLFLCALAVTLLGLFYPVVSRWMLTLVIPSGNDRLILSLMSFLVGCAVARYLFSILQASLVSRVGQKLTLFLQSALFARVLDFPVDFFRRHKTGEIYGCLTLLEPFCTVMTRLFFSTGLSAILSLVYIWELRNAAPGMIVPAVIVLGVQLFLQLSGILGQYHTASRRLHAQMAANTLTLDTLAGIGEIKNFNAQKRAFARWMESYRMQADAEYRPPLFTRLQNELMPASNIFGLVLLFYWALAIGLSDDLFVYFYAAYSMSSTAVMQMSGLGTQIATLRPILSLLRPILEQEPEITSVGRNPGKLKGAININDLSFRYSDQSPLIFDDLNLSVAPGEFLAIVGSSGSGKSTLVRLLLGFEKPQTGAVYYDDENLEHLDSSAVRSQIGVVLQNGKIFSGNVFTNIAISRPDLTEEEAWAAAEAAGLADDIRAMPLGMQTILSEGAASISGGQKQRLLIARAIAQKPSILILDEATSALDNVTQMKVTKALAELQCTRIVIAHRLSTIQDCDRILMLDRGKIIEEGSFQELLSQNGAFARLVQYQLLE